MAPPLDSASSTALRCALGALACGGLAAALLGGCSSDERPRLSAAPAGTAGRSNPPSAAGTSTEGGANAQDSAGAAGKPTETEGGARSGAGAGGVHDPGGLQGSAGDPGLALEPCPSDDPSPPPAFPTVCSAAKGWGPGAVVAVASGAAATFVAVTPSELTLLWREPQSSLPAYFLADRDSVDGAFGEPQELPFTTPVGLSPDGLRLTIQTSAGTFLEATRAARGDSFGEPSLGAYETLVSDAAAHHLVLGDATIAADDRTLYYSARALDAATPYPLRVSVRSAGEPWPAGTPLQACELEAYDEFGPHPTAVSADGLTLFYFDSARGKARAAFRASVNDAFSWFKDLPELAAAQPNAGCDRLYFSPATGKPGLLSAAREP